MKDLISSRHPSPFASQSFVSWDAAIEFLSRFSLKENLKGEVSISREEGEEWKVETNLSKWQRPVRLTTRCRGVGLFDLNW